VPKADYNCAIENHNIRRWILLEWCFTLTSKADTSVWGGRRHQHGYIIQGVSFIISPSTTVLSQSKSASAAARRVSRAATKETQCVILTLCPIISLYPYKLAPSSYNITVQQCICTLHVKRRPDARNRHAFLVC
jgi:hypothetical protein